MSIFTDAPITWTKDTKCDNDAFNKEIKTKLNEIDALFPSGALMQTARASAPTGWLLCQGQAISRATYSDLFTAISTKYGVGDGSTTFNIPNMKGKVPVGLDAGDGDFNDRGKTGGAKTHTLSVAQMPSHSHKLKYGKLAATGTIVDTFHPGVSGITTIYIESTGGGGAHNNLQPFVVINWLIKT